MNMIRFEPWNLINVLQRDLDRFAAPHFGGNSQNGNRVADWVPAVDLVEEKDRFVMRADLPGVDPQDIDISAEDGVLSLVGERQAQASDENNGIRRVERSTGKFYRRFSLPDSADAEGITARSANGILEVAIPKQPEVKARRITVEAA